MKIETEAQAKRYILERVQAELSYQNNLASLLPKYAKAVLKAKTQEDIDLLIASLINEIEDYINTLAAAKAEDDEDETKAIAAFLATAAERETLRETIARHVSDWQSKLAEAEDYGYYPLTRFGRFMIAWGWTKYLFDTATKQGAVAYKVCRGSSYPCSTCDYECSYLHTALDTLPPYHAHCCCYVVPIYYGL